MPIMKPVCCRTGIFLLLSLTMLSGCSKANPAKAAPPAATVTDTPATPAAATVKDTPATARAPAQDLLTARQGFQTRLIANSFAPAGPADTPPPGVFRLVRYPSSAGKLVAYVTPDPRDGRQHPAVLWAHGGFGGIGDFLWKPAPVANDQSARAFREAGLVLMCPSWRGENDNPGRFELFFGEVDDLLAARDYLAALPYVDPDRIYLAGHSTGGTLTLLAAVSTDKFRAAFSFGGAPDLETVLEDGKGYGNTPFDYRSPKESRLRSAIHFVKAIRRPTFYLEGGDSAYIGDATRMLQTARKAGVPFRAFPVDGANHFNILDPLTRLLARKITQDSGPACNVRLTDDEVQATFAARKQ
jgi:dipeptidyl aminopeptidase/acylaminoacyl peptidase